LKWAYLDQNYQHLSSVEVVQMKILYHSLKQLTEEERAFLAGKYRLPLRKGKNELPDAVAAKASSMSFKSYRAHRIAIESRMKPYVLNSVERFEKEQTLGVG
jgi:hypothetical protein